MSGIQNVSINTAQYYATVSSQSQQSLQPFSNLDLSEAQRTKLRSIFNTAKQNGSSPTDVQQQVDSVLTPAQQQTLKSDLAAGAGRHGHGSNAASAESSADSAATDDAVATSPDTASGATTLDAVTNVQNQVLAAQSTLAENLQLNLLANNTASTA